MYLNDKGYKTPLIELKQNVNLEDVGKAYEKGGDL